MIEQVAAIIKEWMDSGYRVIPISVNCSRLNLQKPYLVNEILEIVDQHDIPHEYIEIELTETATIEIEESVNKLFEDLHNAGFKISIDDFGAGHSSLGMLKNLHADIIKLDRSFFIGGKSARRDDLLIDSIVKMAHNLKMYVVAEGIETEEQVELLQSMNCDAVQGYFYDKPMPVSKFEEKYREDMNELEIENSEKVSLIQRINDIKYASSFVPSGMVLAKMDESFTIIEANDYFFEMIGYSRKEVRDLFSNKGINLMSTESKDEMLAYFKGEVELNPDTLLEFITKFKLKNGSMHNYKLSGKVELNEEAEQMIYTSVTDITKYTNME